MGLRPAITTQLFRRMAPAVAVVAAVTVAGSVMVPAAYSAPDKVVAAEKQLAAIQSQSSAIDAKYSDLQDQLDRANAALKKADADLASGDKRVAQLRQGLGQLALVNFQSAGVSTTTQLVTSPSDDSFLTKLAVVQNVTARSNGQLQELQASEAQLAAAQAQAKQSRDQIASLTRGQADLVKQYDAKEKAAQQLLDTLNAQERDRLAKLQAQQNQAQFNQVEAATAQAATTTSRSLTRTDASTQTTTTPAVPASGRASVAIAFALAQVGKAYVYGATGPSAYDCSGLMQAAWAAAGVSLPRTSQAQYGAGTHVSLSALEPGDLVFYYSGISHVAMYIGGGQIVQAANPGAGIIVSSVTSMPVVGATRVG